MVQWFAQFDVARTTLTFQILAFFPKNLIFSFEFVMNVDTSIIKNNNWMQSDSPKFCKFDCGIQNFNSSECLA